MRRRDSLAVEAAFRARVAELGGVVLEPSWLGVNRPHRVRCAAGHECSPRPSNVRQGRGLCRVCAGQDSAVAEAAFRARVVELGGVVLEPSWLGVNRPHRVRCAAGHECNPHPSGLRRRGVGLCRVCAGNDPAVAEAAFRARVVELGGVVLEPSWLGVNRPHRVRCAAGHECHPYPGNLRRGVGLCRVCAGNDPAVAEAAFRARVVELGGVVLEPSWLGSGVPHRVRCSEGHEGNPRPASVQQGQGLCRVCVGQDSAVAEAAFRARVVELGGVVLEPSWLGSQVSHRVLCAAGHECSPRPDGVAQGAGICRVCRGMVWDRFYVVVNRVAARLKLGITSGAGRYRFAAHRSAGYSEIIRSLAVPGANDLERAVLSTLSLGGVHPVGGREYFDVGALGLVLDVVDAWPVPEGVS